MTIIVFILMCLCDIKNILDYLNEDIEGRND